MKKTILYKLLATGLFALTFVFSTNVNMCYASDSVPSEYFEFVEVDNNNPRMDSNGDFTFEIEWSIRSQVFYATSDTMTVTTCAQIIQYGYLWPEGRVLTDSSVKFTVELTDLTDGRRVGIYQGYCDGVNGGVQYNVIKDHKYRLEIINLGGLPDNSYISGSGHVTNISLTR